MKRILPLLLFIALPLLGADPRAEIGVSMFGGTAAGFGSLTPTAWRVHEGRGAGARLTVFLNESIGAAIDFGRQRIESRAGAMTSDSHALPEAVMLDWYGAPHARVVAYLGAGASYLKYRQNHVTADGQLDQPDHGALMTEAGVKYLLSSRWRLNTGLRFGPARSTAEVNHAAGQVERIDFHQFYLSGGVGYCF
ncbi:MAG TPA: OmpW family outer membrane protein [Thermoanaerobaculia bacterium]|nr:OmpW family outer membrane protein [Thermoanaerobaculia bacterium]